MSQEFVQLEIWDLLEEAKQEPFEVDWNVLWNSLDVSLVDLESSEQLQVAAEALLQMVEVFHIRSMEAFEELEVYRSNDGAVMGDRDFAPFVRQFMNIDFDEFVEPLVSPIPRTYTHAGGDERQSIVEVVDREVLLEIAEEYHEGSSQQEATSVIEIAHSENVSDWIKAIANYFIAAGVKVTTWSELRKKVNIAPAEMFMGLLLGNFTLRQTLLESSSFYDTEILIETC